VWYATSCTQTDSFVGRYNKLPCRVSLGRNATQRDATSHTKSDRPLQHHAVIRNLCAHCSRLSNVWDTTLASLTSASARNRFATVWFLVLKRFSTPLVTQRTTAGPCMRAVVVGQPRLLPSALAVFHPQSPAASISCHSMVVVVVAFEQSGVHQSCKRLKPSSSSSLRVPVQAALGTVCGAVLLGAARA
jgi:hypothetical protein